VAEPFIGEIKMMSFNFAPRGWALCNGQTLPINQNQALFSLLGTTYGGNGQSTFQLPNLQSRVPNHMGAGFVEGQVGGAETVQLNTTQLPQHNHLLQAANTAGLSAKPFNKFLAQSSTGVDGSTYLPGAANLTALNPASLQPAGSGGAHSNIQPYLTINFSIALQGVFPSRN
jgi:microcystin-dependent protein